MKKLLNKSQERTFAGKEITSPQRPNVQKMLPSKLTAPDDGVITTVYNELGQLVRQFQKVYTVTQGGNCTTTYGYDSRGLPTSINASGVLNMSCVTYTDFKKVAQITEDDNQLDITYGVGQQRIKTVLSNLSNPSGALTRYYTGNYEEELRNNITRKIHYINGGNGLAAIYVQNNGKDTLYYAHTDFQGSLLALSLMNGTVSERYAYDPWGNRRNPTNWTQSDTRKSFILHRGYTLHEHLPAFNLINMNGRVYDPLVSQFLSPDPYLQSPGYWLNYNRYAYAYGNPLIYTDPSGEKLKWWHWVLGDILTGGAVTGFMLANYVVGSEPVYKIQKMTSPVAIKPTFHFGSDVTGYGFDVSIGMPTVTPGYRWHFGGTYYEDYYDEAYSGWEWRSGSEATLIPGVSYSGTTFKSGEISQTTNQLTIGGPIFNTGSRSTLW